MSFRLVVTGFQSKKTKNFLIHLYYDTFLFCRSNICQTKLIMFHKLSVEQHLKLNIILFSGRPCILTKSIFLNGVSGFCAKSQFLI